MALREKIYRNQFRGHRLKTAPTVESVSAAELRTYVRAGADVLTDVEAETLLEQARQFIEQMTGLAFNNQTWTLTLDHWPGYREQWWDGIVEAHINTLIGGPSLPIEFPRFPLVSVDSIKVYDEDSTATYVLEPIAGSPERAWVELTTADTELITFQNVGENVIYVKATSTADEPTDDTGVIEYPVDAKETNVALDVLFPGISSPVRLWAFTEAASSVFVSHAPDTNQTVTVDPAPEQNAIYDRISSYFDVDTYSFPGRLKLRKNKIWPEHDKSLNSIEIDYSAGFGSSADDVPPVLRRAVLQMAGFMFDHRGECDLVDSYRKSGAKDLASTFAKVRL